MSEPRRWTLHVSDGADPIVVVCRHRPTAFGACTALPTWDQVAVVEAAARDDGMEEAAKIAWQEFMLAKAYLDDEPEDPAEYAAHIVRVVGRMTSAERITRAIRAAKEKP